MWVWIVEIYLLLVYDYFFNCLEYYIIFLLRYWYFEEVNKYHGWLDDILLIIEWNINKIMIFWALKWTVNEVILIINNLVWELPLCEDKVSYN